jgi:predicted MFS family arabinose efflux permease
MKTLLKLYIDSYRGLSPAAWLLALVMLINRIGSMVLPFLGIYMSTELGFDKAQVGIVLGCFGLGSVCGSWLGGWLTDRFGSFKVQGISLILAVPLFLITSQVKSFEGLALMVFILTIIADTFRPANSVSVATYAKSENITRAYSLNRMAVNLGFSIGPAMGGFLATISYDWIFYGNAIGAGVAAIVFIYFFANRKAPQREPIKRDDTQSAVPRNAYTDKIFIVFNILCFLFSLAFFQLLGTLPLYYKDVHILNEHQIGLLLGFSGFVIVIFEMVLVHAVEHRFSIRNILLWGTLITAVSYSMLNVHIGVWWLYLAMFMLSMGEMLILPFTARLAIRRAGLDNQGAYMGFNSLAFSAALVFSPYLGMTVIDHWGYTTLWFITGTILVLVSIGFYSLAPKMRS